MYHSIYIINLLIRCIFIIKESIFNIKFQFTFKILIMRLNKRVDTRFHKRNNTFLNKLKIKFNHLSQ